MRFLFRTASLAVVAALAATVVLFEPCRESNARQPQEALPFDLALVPTDAAGFVHIRGAELWKSDVFARLRATFEKAGPKAIAALETQFVPKITTFDRATAFALIAEKRHEPIPFAILRFNTPFEVAEVVTTYLPKATAVKVEGKSIYRSEEAPFELYFPDHQHIVIGLPATLETYLKHESPKTGPLSPGLKLAAAGKPIVLSVNIGALPIEPKELAEAPPELKRLLKAEHITATLDITTNAKIEVVAGYKNAPEAEDAEKAIKSLAEMGRKELGRLKGELEKKLFDPKANTPKSPTELPETLLMVFGLGAINEADELLANPAALIKRNGSELSASITLPKEIIVSASGLVAVGAGLMIPAVQKVRSAAGRATSQNNLKQIALAVHAYHDAFGHFPQDIVDKNGKPLLSWRVAILPFIEQNSIYQQFKQDEPWDSQNNKQWSQIAIKTFMSPQADPPTPPGMTQYKAFVGPGTVFEPGKKIKFTDIPDGTSNTIMFIEAGDPIPWAKPGDIPYDPKKPLPKLALPGVENFVNVALCDGSVRTISMKTITEKTLRNAITRDDGEVLGSDW